MRTLYMTVFLVLVISSVALAGFYDGKGGVKRVVNAGTKTAQGNTIYIIECKNGASTTVGKKDGQWWTMDMIRHIGSKYDNLSLDDLAQKACNN